MKRLRADILQAVRWSAMASIAALTGCSSDGALVGIHCAPGYEACGHVCVNLQVDPTHCGSCERACGANASCVSGACVGAQDGGLGQDAQDGKDSGTAAGGSAGSSPGDGGAGRAGDGGSAGVAGSAGNSGGGSAGAGGSAGSGGGTVGVGGEGGGAGAEPPEDAQAEPLDTDAAETGEQDALDTDVEVEAGDEPVDPDSGIVCIPPYDNIYNCGGCGVVCVEPLPLCKLVKIDGGVPEDAGEEAEAGEPQYACAELCDPPLTRCGYECKNLESDEDNCGACGNHCVTGLCAAGNCVGLAVGHVVLMGMDFTNWYANSPPARLFSNAVFLPTHNPLRILTYTEYGDSTATGSVTSVQNLLAYSSQQEGRPYVLTDGGPSSSFSTLLDPSAQDVVLILDQVEAPAGGLYTIGQAWKEPLSDFVRAGGVVVVLLSAQGQNEMPKLLEGAGLGEITSVQDITAPFHILANIAPYDAIGINVISPFLARPHTVTFQTPLTPSNDTVFVVQDTTHGDAGPSDPVVIHRVVAP